MAARGTSEERARTPEPGVQAETRAASDGAEMVNRVSLVGRVSGSPVERDLPSGDRVVTVRVVVPREPAPTATRRRSDWVDCAAWTKRLQRTVVRWQPGDVVTVEGALRRRFVRGTSGAASLVEVELVTARRVVKA